MSTVKSLEFIEGVDVGAPTDLSIATSTTFISAYVDDAAFVTANGPATEGDSYLNTTSKRFRHYVGGAWRDSLPASDAADATKKFDIDLTGATTGTTATLDINNTASRTYTMQDESGTIPVLPILLASEVSGVLPTANGGTGQNSTATFPTSGTVATQEYVQQFLQGLDAKNSVKCATTANITLSGEQTIDGVLTSSSRVLVKNQSSSAENGIYVSSSGSWARATDNDTWTEVPSAFVFVEEGTVNADTGWVCIANDSGTIGVTAMPWTQIAGAGAYTAGAGLTLSGTQFSLTSPVAIANGGTGQTSQTAAFDALAPTTTKGDLIAHDGSDNIRVAVGANGQVLTADSAQASGLSWTSTLTNPMTTRGDIIRGGVGGAAERLSAVTDNRVVAGDGTDVVSKQIDDPNFFTTGAEVTQSLPGVVKSAGQLRGTNTNDSASPGYVGEVVTSTGSSNNMASNDVTNANLTSIALTPGHWRISANFSFNVSGGSARARLVDGGISTSTAFSGIASNGLSGITTCTQNAYTDAETILFGNGTVGLTVPERYVQTTGSPTYYIVARWIGTKDGGASVNGTGTITAVRIR